MVRIKWGNRMIWKMNRREAPKKIHRIYNSSLKKIWMKASKIIKVKAILKTRRNGKRPLMRLERKTKTIIQRINR